MALKQRHKTDEMVTEKHKDGLNIDRDMVYSSKWETTVFEIQTRNIHNPPTPLPQEALIDIIIILLYYYC